MAANTITIRVNASLADEAKKLLGVKSRAQAVRVALAELVSPRRFKVLTKKNAGKLKFTTAGE